MCAALEPPISKYLFNFFNNKDTISMNFHQFYDLRVLQKAMTNVTEIHYKKIQNYHKPQYFKINVNIHTKYRLSMSITISL